MPPILISSSAVTMTVHRRANTIKLCDVSIQSPNMLQEAVFTVFKLVSSSIPSQVASAVLTQVVRLLLIQAC